jgi:hypothetical protein
MQQLRWEESEQKLRQFYRTKETEIERQNPQERRALVNKADSQLTPSRARLQCKGKLKIDAR